METYYRTSTLREYNKKIRLIEGKCINFFQEMMFYHLRETLLAAKNEKALEYLKHLEEMTEKFNEELLERRNAAEEEDREPLPRKKAKQ